MDFLTAIIEDMACELIGHMNVADAMLLAETCQAAHALFGRHSRAFRRLIGPDCSSPNIQHVLGLALADLHVNGLAIPRVPQQHGTVEALVYALIMQGVPTGWPAWLHISQTHDRIAVSIGDITAVHLTPSTVAFVGSMTPPAAMIPGVSLHWLRTWPSVKKDVFYGGAACVDEPGSFVANVRLLGPGHVSQAVSLALNCDAVRCIEALMSTDDAVRNEVKRYLPAMIWSEWHPSDFNDVSRMRRMLNTVRPTHATDDILGAYLLADKHYAPGCLPVAMRRVVTAMAHDTERFEWKVYATRGKWHQGDHRRKLRQSMAATVDHLMRHVTDPMEWTHAIVDALACKKLPLPVTELLKALLDDMLPRIDTIALDEQSPLVQAYARLFCDMASSSTINRILLTHSLQDQLVAHGQARLLHLAWTHNIIIDGLPRHLHPAVVDALHFTSDTLFLSPDATDLTPAALADALAFIAKERLQSAVKLRNIVHSLYRFHHIYNDDTIAATWAMVETHYGRVAEMPLTLLFAVLVLLKPAAAARIPPPPRATFTFFAGCVLAGMVREPTVNNHADTIVRALTHPLAPVRPLSCDFAALASRIINVALNQSGYLGLKRRVVPELLLAFFLVLKEHMVPDAAAAAAADPLAFWQRVMHEIAASGLTTDAATQFRNALESAVCSCPDDIRPFI